MLPNNRQQVAKNVSVIIATKGRPQVVYETILSILKQSKRPQQVIVSVTCKDDIPNCSEVPLPIEIVNGPAGTTRQLNRARQKLLHATEFVAILDDDVELHPYFIEDMLDIVSVFPAVDILNGHCIDNQKS